METAPRPPSCLEPEALFLYSEGLLEPTQTRDVATHLAECPDCRRRYRVEAELTVSLRALPLPEPRTGFAAGVADRIRESSRNRAPRWWWPAAALLALAPTVLWFASGGTSVADAAMSLLEFVVSLVRAPLALADWLSSAQTWADLGAAAEAVLSAVAGSPAYLATILAAVLMVAVATNTLLYVAARRTLITHR